MTAVPNIRKTIHYKTVISLLLGLIGLCVNLQVLQFDFPPYQAVLMPGLALPMVAALAWGWPYGLLSAAVGLGGQSLWHPGWPSDGWRLFVVIPPLTLWMVWHAWCASRHRHNTFPALNPYYAEIPYRLCHSLALFAILHWSVPSSIQAVEPLRTASSKIVSQVLFTATEQTINAYVVLLMADILMSLGPIRKFLGLKKCPGRLVTGYVISASLVFGLLFWIIDGLVDYYKFREHLRFLIFKAPEGVLDSILLNVSSPDLFARTAFVVTCLTAGLIVARLLQNQIQGQIALRQSETRYRRLHETMSDAFVQKDMFGKIVDSNQAYQQMIGHSNQKLLGIKEIDLTPTWWHDTEAKIIADQVVPHGKSEVYEKEYIRKDGTVFPVELRTFLITDDADIPLGMWAIVRDITQRKQGELEREKTMVALERSNEDLKQFAYVASHDLQEPLRMVSSYTQLLSERYGERLDEKAHKFINYAVDGATRMQALIRDLLAFTRVETRAESLKTIDAHNALGKAIANLKTMIDETATLVMADDLPRVRADETQLVQVFQNLVNNGIKFRGSAPACIHISSRPMNDHWRFSVEDNGIGIESRFKDKIFVIFQRLHTRDEYPGTGIGLALCKRIIDRHHGRIWFESIPGKGTTFYFTIPFLESEEPTHGEHSNRKTHRYSAGGG